MEEVKTKKKMKKWKKVLLIILVIILILSCIIAGTLYSFYLNIKPKLFLEGPDEVTISLKQDYIEPGYDSYFDIYNFYRRDLSKEVKVVNNINNEKIGTYEVKYSIKYKYLKKTNSITRKVKVTDGLAPEIILEGKKEITLYVNNKYKEPGFKVKDNYDKDLESKVVIDNKVDIKTPGEYTITYTVTDSSGNETSVERKVIIKEKPTEVVTTSDIKSITATPSGTGAGLPILMYHFFYDASAGQTGPDANYMEIHAFEEQMKYLHDNGYYYPSWQEVADFIDGKISLPSKSVVVTADDGNKSFFDLAVPILHKYEVKATSFIITKYSGDFYLTHKDPYVSYQSHTNSMHEGGCAGGTNGKMRCISLEDGIADLKKSYELLGNSDALAYPFGETGGNAVQIAIDSGVKVAVTTAEGKAKRGMNKYKLPRKRMYKGQTLSAFISKL